MRRKVVAGLGSGMLLGGTGFLGACGSLKGGAAAGVGREYVLRNGYVVTLDRALGDIPRGDVHVRDGAIVAVGRSLDAAGVDTIDATGMLVVPGFIDTHFHLWNTTLRNMQRRGFEYFPVKEAFVRHYTAEDFYRSDRLALAELINAGITTTVNFSHNIRSAAHADAELRAMQESGIRGRYAYGWSDPTPRTQTTNFDDLKRVRSQWFGASSPFQGRIDLGMAIRGPVHSEPAVIDAEFKMARQLGLPTILHTGATKRRALSVARLQQGGYLERSTILSHWIGQKEADLDALLKAGCSVSFSPQSDLRTPYDNSFHDSLLELRQKAVNLCLSIDSSVLGAVSMFEQMSTTWYMGVPYLDTPMEKTPFVDFIDVLEMATINGARAMGIDSKVGSLHPGKRADIVLVRSTDLNMAPLGEAHGALVKAASVANVDTVICDGRVLKRGGRLVGIDVQQVVSEAEQTLAALRSRAGPDWLPRAARATDPELTMRGACA